EKDKYCIFILSIKKCYMQKKRRLTSIIRNCLLITALCVFSLSHLFSQELDEDDSISFQEIQNIKIQKELDRIKDSLRLDILREELSRTDRYSLEELEKYKSE